MINYIFSMYICNSIWYILESLERESLKLENYVTIYDAAKI